MVIENKQYEITKQMLSEDNQMVAWYYVSFPNENVRAQLETLAWFRLGKTGHIARINKEFIGFTDQTTAESFTAFMDTPEFRAFPKTLWDDADDFNRAADEGAIALAGNIPFEESMLDIDNKSITKWVKDLWLYMKIACRARVWHHSDRFWFENKADMVLFSAYIGEQDIKEWQKVSETSGTIDHATLLELLRKRDNDKQWGNTSIGTPEWIYRPTTWCSSSVSDLGSGATSIKNIPYIPTSASEFDTSDDISTPSIRDQIRERMISALGGMPDVLDMYSNISENTFVASNEFEDT